MTVSKINSTQDTITIIKKWMGCILYLAAILEMVFFPSWQNLCGCLMALVCWEIFRIFFFKKTLILEHPFAFAMFLSMILYRYLPLIATLAERKPVTYGFEMAYETFFFETILFIISAMAFHFACNIRSRKNNLIQKTLFKLNFFDSNIKVLWGVGLIGVVAQVYVYMNAEYDNAFEYGDVEGKFASGITYLMYAPLCLLFPGLLKKKVSKSKLLIWSYFAFIVVLSFASNSRTAVITPIATIILLLFLHLLHNNISIKTIISPRKLVVIVVILILGLGFLSDISLAMLANRKDRKDMKTKELFYKTIETYRNKEEMRKLHTLESLANNKQLEPYVYSWDETYISNFMLNRYGNMRITDQTLYHAHRVGFMNQEMLSSFSDRFWASFPTPILKALNISIDKRNMEYSPGDLLAGISLGGYVVTSHVGDGLATFGYWYFPIQFILFFCVFKLLDCFVFYTKSSVRYAALGLMNFFVFFGMFRNAGGCMDDLQYCVRGFWQFCITFFIISVVLKSIFSIRETIISARN